MNSDWKAFLQEQGAVFISTPSENPELDKSDSENHLAFFNQPESEIQISSQELLLSNPSERGLIKVNGADAESFLQNQLTNDIRNVNDMSHQASAWCSPKGRIIANFRIFKQDDSYYLSLSADLIEHVIKKLRMYVMMSKVEIEDVTHSVIHFTFAGKNADKQIQKMLDIEVPADAETIRHNEITLLRSVLAGQDDSTRFDVFASDITQAKSFWSECNKLASALSGAGSRYLNILSGLPEITAKSSEAWIPQMVNYIHTKGVDFKKGCYPGQEVVARLNYLGKTKRRMYRLLIATEQQPAVGAVINSNKDTEAGKVLSAVVVADGLVEALAVLKIAEASNPLTLADNDATISFLDLPYSVDDE